jgi:hypothetical protein
VGAIHVSTMTIPGVIRLAVEPTRFHRWASEPWSQAATPQRTGPTWGMKP